MGTMAWNPEPLLRSSQSWGAKSQSFDHHFPVEHDAVYCTAFFQK
jgi:hypothetical protein